MSQSSKTTMNNKVRTRFAPSPTGFMHIGNLRTCLYAYLFTKQSGGDFILRIEDTDRERLVDGAVEVIYSTLKTAGIHHDEGPDVGGDFGPYVQSERADIYLEYAKKLVESGGAYYCFCDKDRLDNLADSHGVKKYDKHCMSLSKAEILEKLASGIPYVIRQNIPTEGISCYEDLVFGEISVPCADMEDNVLIKSDGMPTYNFANVVDDHLMGITHVIRGNEYLSSTPKYNLIYDSFGWERPEYIHLSPIMKDKERKLSKRFGDANFEDFIEKGYLPHAIVNYIALLGWYPKENKEKLTMDELTKQFDIKSVSKSGSIFDENHMRFLNSEYIKELSADEFLKLATPWLDKSKVAGQFDYSKLAKLLQTRIDILSEIPEKINFLMEFDKYPKEMYEHTKMKITTDLAKSILEVCLQTFENVDNWTEEYLKSLVPEIAEKAGVKNGQVFLPLRLALTGVAQSPGGATEMADLLGKEESLRRIKTGLEILS